MMEECEVDAGGSGQEAGFKGLNRDTQEEKRPNPVFSSTVSLSKELRSPDNAHHGKEH